LFNNTSASLCHTLTRSVPAASLLRRLHLRTRAQECHVSDSNPIAREPSLRPPRCVSNPEPISIHHSPANSHRRGTDGRRTVCPLPPQVRTQGCPRHCPSSYSRQEAALSRCVASASPFRHPSHFSRIVADRVSNRFELEATTRRIPVSTSPVARPLRLCSSTG
jgi:hypothetical protein